MADPIMDLFEDTPLFNLDALPDDSFSQGSSDPVEEALKLALGQVDAPAESEPTPELTVSTGLGASVAASPAIPDPAPVQTPAQQPVPVVPAQTVSIAATPTVVPAPVETVPQIQAQATIPIVSNASVATSSTVLLSSPLTVSTSPATTTATTQQLTQITHQLTPQQLAAITQQAGGKIVILKGPQGQAQVLQTVSGATGQTSGKVIRVLSGTPLKPGMSILQGGTVLNQANPGQSPVKVGAAGVQRLLQSPNGPVKQVLLTSMPQQTQGQQVQVQIPAQAQMTQGQTQVQVQPQGQATQIQVQAQGQVQLQPAMQAQTQVSATSSNSTGTPQGDTMTAAPQWGMFNVVLWFTLRVVTDFQKLYNEVNLFLTVTMSLIFLYVILGC